MAYPTAVQEILGSNTTVGRSHVYHKSTVLDTGWVPLWKCTDFCIQKPTAGL